MIVSDALSRQPDHDNEKSDNTDIVMILDQAFIQQLNEPDKRVNDTSTYLTMIPHYLVARAVNAPLLEDIKREHECTPIVLEAIQAPQGKGPTPARTSLEDWQTDGALIWYQDQIYVPISL